MALSKIFAEEDTMEIDSPSLSLKRLLAEKEIAEQRGCETNQGPPRRYPPTETVATHYGRNLGALIRTTT